MGFKAIAAHILARYTALRIARRSRRALAHQERTLRQLLATAAHTQFGKDHHFSEITNHSQFVQRVPIRDYEALRPWLDRVVNGEADVTWPGQPIYLSKTSGTTSGTKYIPISAQSIGHHIAAARDALLLYIACTGKARFVDGKMIFLQGSPELQKKNGIPLGRLSGIVAHHVPAYLQKNRLPSYATNTIGDWEKKIEAIVRETVDQPMSLISGIPSWVQTYFEKLIAHTGRNSVSEVFPHFDLFVYGGVNFEPYRSRFEKLIGAKVDTIETYPASEGFIAYQSEPGDPGLLLNVDAGIYFEFVPVERYFDEDPPRLGLSQVALGVQYALLLSTNAGLWAYSIGDTVKFTSLQPYKIVVTGRIKHFTSAFGEHVIAEEVEGAMQEVLCQSDARIIEFTVAPQISPAEGLPYHEWLISFDQAPKDISAFAEALDRAMQRRNSYYADLINGRILRTLRISELSRDAFNAYMKSQGKLGGQNKVPRLSNDRRIADALQQWLR